MFIYIYLLNKCLSLLIYYFIELVFNFILKIIVVFLKDTKKTFYDFIDFGITFKRLIKNIEYTKFRFRQS